MSAIEVIRRFRDLRALAIGDAMLDTYLEGSAARLCSEGPVPVVRKTGEERAPGGAANSAANLRALGAQVDFIGLVGPDAAGAALRAALRRHGVDDRWLVEDADVGTLHKLRIVADGQYVVRVDEGETRACSDEAQARLLAALDALYPRCDLVLISDYGYGVASAPLVDRLRALRAARPCVLVVDSKHLRHFRHACPTAITPNHLEARLLVEPGRPAVPPTAGGQLDVAGVVRIGRQVLAQVNAEHAVITLGRDGVCLIPRHGEATHLPASPVVRASDVGAGDSFAAALALALAAGASIEQAATIGIDAAAIAVARPRTAVVGHEDLRRRASLRDSLHPNPAPQAVAALAERLEAERAAGRTIVFTNGIFDLLHAGHVAFLRQARALGDVLVVGVNSDRGARLLKGDRRPITGERDRLALVAALDVVDHAILFDEATPASLIRRLRPHLHVKGGDYADVELPEAAAVEEVGGRVVILPRVSPHSTTAVIDRILALAGMVEVGR